MQKILIIGAKGMLGQELVKVFRRDKQYAVTAWEMADLDVTNQKQVAQKVGKLKPNLILNTAAYNAVDKCEADQKEFALAKKLNGVAPGYLAAVAKKIGATLIHYSTDYVFDGSPEIDLEPAGCTHSCGSCHLHESADQRSLPEIGFREDAKPKPINNYGKSKLMGERAVQKEKGKYYIIRLSKLFGLPGKSESAKRSFFDMMLEAGKKNKEVKVIDEETDCFTYAPDLAKKTKEIIEAKKPFGVYHVTNSGVCTWYEAVQELYRQAKLKTKIIPISGEELPRPAKRPFISTLINTKCNPLRSWQAALKEYLQQSAKSLKK
ncbi:dTDP-4-dehydrorhamnose reductase [Patescibacteria group bacterium]|nr:MAG: dTDP-4-dehydrorhamnose reductase [Patescibacteria group bacterium]